MTYLALTLAALALAFAALALLAVARLTRAVEQWQTTDQDPAYAPPRRRPR